MADERTEIREDREKGSAAGGVGNAGGSAAGSAAWNAAGAAGVAGGAEGETEAVRGGDAYRRDLLELQKVDFALVELSLYLNTHPSDLEAIRQFNRLAQQRARIAGEFEMKYGPLMQFGHSYSRYPWQWPNTPWPWQV